MAYNTRSVDGFSIQKKTWLGLAPQNGAPIMRLDSGANTTSYSSVSIENTTIP